ncbi:carbohydrate sulfotransferase 11-like isoform X3 [Ptychodera flava]
MRIHRRRLFVCLLLMTSLALLLFLTTIQDATYQQHQDEPRDIRVWDDYDERTKLQPFGADYKNSPTQLPHSDLKNMTGLARPVKDDGADEPSPTILKWTHLTDNPQNLDANRSRGTEKSREEKFLQRRAQIDKTCRSRGTKAVNGFFYRQALVSDEYKVIFCPVAKAANSNWRRIFLYLNDIIEDPMSLHENVYKYRYRTLSFYNERGRAERLHSYTKFMFARNPFSRFLSAYRDKFEKKQSSKLAGFGIYDKRIKKIAGSDNITSPDRPTFEEFVKYRIQAKYASNEHWALMGRLCSPCSVNYNYIGTFETLNEDADFILKKIGVGGHIKFPNYVPHKTNSSQADLLHKYYSKISKKDMKLLYNTYRYDFEMFGYSKPEFM